MAANIQCCIEFQRLDGSVITSVCADAVNAATVAATVAPGDYRVRMIVVNNGPDNALGVRLFDNVQGFVDVTVLGGIAAGTFAEAFRVSNFSTSRTVSASAAADNAAPTKLASVQVNVTAPVQTRLRTCIELLTPEGSQLAVACADALGGQVVSAGSLGPGNYRVRVNVFAFDANALNVISFDDSCDSQTGLGAIGAGMVEAYEFPIRIADDGSVFATGCVGGERPKFQRQVTAQAVADNALITRGAVVTFTVPVAQTTLDVTFRAVGALGSAQVSSGLSTVLQVQPGESIIMDYNVCNLGPVNAENVVATDPTGTTIVGGIPVGSCAHEGPFTVTAPASGQATYAVQAQGTNAPQTAPATIILSVVPVLPPTLVVCQALRGVTSDVCASGTTGGSVPATVVPGTYTVDVKVTVQGGAANVIVDDDSPGGETNLGNVGATPVAYSYPVEARSDGKLYNGSGNAIVNNRLSVRATSTTPNVQPTPAATIQVTVDVVTPAGQLVAILSPSAVTARPGKVVTFTLTVKNTGTVNVTGITATIVRDTTPVTTFDLGSLTPGQSRDQQFTVQAPPAAMVAPSYGVVVRSL